MKKIFVTGAAGFVGSHLVPLLIKNGYQVTALVRLKADKKFVPKNAKIVVGDLSQKGSWQKKLKNHDCIVHLAAEISSKTQEAFERNNVLSTVNLLDAANRAKLKKFILFSSAAVTSIRQDWYSQTKKRQEELVIESKMDYSIIRPSMIYGPGDTKNIGWLIKIIKKMPAVPLPGGGTFGRQPVYVEDICNIVLKLIKNKNKQKIFEIHGYRYIPMSQMVKVIIKQLNSTKPIFPVPLICLTIPFLIGEKVLSHPKFTLDQIKSITSGEKFRGEKWWKTFDIIPTTFEQGIANMLKKDKQC